ncbi:hypothetical protein [Levilactobacillus mulengensis]|uniref:hypothetical protein n=1 Tax=Levilactobacillus mulengensis TaxID=2486025 RepID=UPI0013DDA9B1|nr:hypothetical protein [Levilactobacillus mulengensis]
MAQAPLSTFEPMIPQVAELLAEDTKQRHIADMRKLLAAGYKSKRAYGSRPKA